MVLGLSMSAFTTLHVVISLVAMLAGAVMLAGLLKNRPNSSVIAFFLLTTILTSVTGFLFPISVILPSHIVGAISLVVLAISLFALYGRHLVGWWRGVFIVSALFAFYLNVFVGVVQAFLKLPFLHDLAPNGNEPPFFASQLAVLLAFVLLGILAARRFRPFAPLKAVA